MAESYDLNIANEEPAAWLLKLAIGQPSLLPSWPDNPYLAVVVAMTAVAEDGQPDYDQVAVACTRAALRELAAWEEERKKLFFTVDRTRLLRVCSQIDPDDFEE